jgi:pimeloyl-ACP methyl ester carboxylesterase
MVADFEVKKKIPVYSDSLTWGIITVRRVISTLFRILAVAILLITVGLGFRAYRQHINAQILAIHTPNGIQEGMYIPIGGIEQWIQIRGEDRNNPVLLFVHGGPGASTLMFSSGWQPWEKYFTVVQWDERGTGRTYRKTGSSIAPTMTVDRMTQDGIEVVEFLRTHLHKNKVILVGHSWGSFLGIHMIKKRPDLFFAYVGTGQLIGVPTWKTMAMNSAQGFHDSGLGNNLKISPLMMPGFTLLDWYYFSRGYQLSQKHLLGPKGPMGKADLRSLGLDFSVPIFFFEGTQDFMAPLEPVEQYFEEISAPHKEFVQFEGSNHFLPLNRPDEFLKELCVRVRPLIVLQ